MYLFKHLFSLLARRTPKKYAQFLWQIGKADRMGGEFALGNHTREWELPGMIPGMLQLCAEPMETL